MGPIDLLVVKFPGNHFHGELAPRLVELVDSGIIRIIDLVFITKDPDGNVLALELTDLPEELTRHWGSVAIPEDGVGLSDEDILSLAAGLEPNSSGGMLLFENTWAIGFKQALENADGQVLLFERIPGPVIDELEMAVAGGQLQ